MRAFAVNRSSFAQVRAVALRDGPGIQGSGGRRLDGKTYVAVLKSLLAAAISYQLVRPVPTNFDVEGWRLAANALRLVAAEGRRDGRSPSPYFVELYRN